MMSRDFHFLFRLTAAVCATAALMSLGGCKVKISTEGLYKDSKARSETSETSPTAAATPKSAVVTPAGAVPARPKSARVMSYNIQYFSAAAATQGDRVKRLRQIVDDIKPDVVAVQETADRAAMELVFDPEHWIVFIDDDSADKQDVAFAVRKPWRITNAPGDLDADDEHFLASGAALNSFFPVRRDALFADIATPDGAPAFTAVNIHAKARVGGRSNTEPRRVGASRYLVETFKTKLAGKNVVLMGDFNDSPDDVSLNVLETGDPNAAAGQNAWPADFMVNLFQPLWERGMVTEGASDRRLDPATGLINNVYPDARPRNNNSRTRNVGTGPIMFDQILVSRALAPGAKPETGHIYLKPLALTGPGFSRPSDHLPIYADIPLPQ